jgi:hypothetical protein
LRFISELEEKAGLVWSSMAITLVVFRDEGFSATRRSTQLNGSVFQKGEPPSGRMRKTYEE